MEKNTYTERLEKMLEEITHELKTVGIHSPENPSDWIAVPENLDAEEPDENVSADSKEDWNERNALVATLEAQYNNIVLALKKVAEGSFGKCEICGSPIEPARLDANPAAQTCVAHLEEKLT